MVAELLTAPPAPEMARGPDAGKYSEAIYEVPPPVTVRVRMRDDTRMSLDIYLPKSPEHLPTLLITTPYGRQIEFFQKYVRWYAPRGYVVAIADVRGRYDSEGTWNPFDGRHAVDGYDLVEWLAAQTWSNAKVGMVGLSYQAWTQWWTASTAPPHLAAIVPQTAPPSGFENIPYQNGVLTGWWLQWCALMPGRTIQPVEFQQFGGLPGILNHPPYIEIGTFLGVGSETWFRQMYSQNRADDPYWKALSYQTPESYSRITIPSLAFGGWFDVDHSGTSLNYQGMRRFGATREARRPRMIIGPWVHHINTRVTDGIDYGAEAVIDADGYSTRWLDHYLKGIDNGVENDPPVYVFVMGENRWHAEQDWPLPQTRWTKYYLISDGHANTSNGDGRLTTTQPLRSGVDKYLYDPRHPTPDPFDSTRYEDHGARDTRLSASGKDVLVYQTPELTIPTEVTGPIHAVLYAETSARDTDWMVRLVDVQPDGRSLLLAEGVIRARNRDPANEGCFNGTQLSTIEPGRIYRYTIRFWRNTGNLFKAGHRIRVEISSSWYPFFAPNLNTGADNLAMVSLTDAVVANQTIHHGGDYPSHILLPVIPARQGERN